MNQYEVTFIVDPVLSGDEIKATAQTYVEAIKKQELDIVHIDEMGLRQLAYPINRRTSGVYYCIEFQAPNGTFIDKMELSFRRDERIMRFLTVKLDKYGVKYNQDKRDGKIGKVKKDKDSKKSESSRKSAPARSSNKPAPKPAAPAPAPKPAAPAPTTEAKSEAKSEEE